MSIEVVKLELQHWTDLQAQEATAYLGQYIQEEHVSTLIHQPFSFAGVIDGRVVAIGGVIQHWPGRGEAWAELAQICRKEFLMIHNAVKRFLEICPYERVEATADKNFEAAHRWLRLLGFEMEAETMRKYSPDGRDYSLYARIK